MKKLTILLVLVFCSCTPERTILLSQRETWGYRNWKQNFKDRTLCKCLIGGYNDPLIRNKIFKIDKSLFDPISIVLFDSVISNILESKFLKMKKDSIESIKIVSEPAAGKLVFKSCLKFYRSEKLDSLTKVEAKKWKNIKNIDTLIHKKMPMY